VGYPGFLAEKAFDHPRTGLQHIFTKRGGGRRCCQSTGI
jgi:hypothetical protein